MKVLQVACVTVFLTAMAASTAMADTLWLRDKPGSGVSSLGAPGGMFVNNSQSRPDGSLTGGSLGDIPTGVYELQTSPTNSDPWTDLLTFCLEPQQDALLPALYTTGDLDGYQNLDSTRVDWIEELWAAQFEGTKTNSTNAAAFQFVVWELVADTSFDLTAGSIRLSGSEAAFALANTWYDNLTNNVWTDKASLQGLFSETSQDYLIPTSGGGETTTGAESTGGEVPEPASLLLLGSGIAGVARLRRRRDAK